jgi:ferritin-like metal-binding protein YciE
MKTGSMKHVYIDERRDVRSAEQRLVRAGPRMAKAAQSDTLIAEYGENEQALAASPAREAK